MARNKLRTQFPWWGLSPKCWTPMFTRSYSQNLPPTYHQFRNTSFLTTNLFCNLLYPELSEQSPALSLGLCWCVDQPQHFHFQLCFLFSPGEDTRAGLRLSVNSEVWGSSPKIATF